MANKLLQTRTEILFLYDITDGNPNGDPNDENRPRMDMESGRAKVSDVRLKRTARDYLNSARGQEIFCRPVEKSDGTLQEGKDRAEDFFRLIEAAGQKVGNVIEKRNLIAREVIKQCIDVRLFGATIPVKATKTNEKDSSVTLTGAVQFAMASSLHRVQPVLIKGTGAFASGQGKQQRTFREEHVLPYGLICFYGVANPEAAKTSGMTEDDAEALYGALWYGTKNLITRSKVGQRPLLLLLVDYADPNAYIGRLDRFLGIATREGLRDEEIRGLADLTLNTESLQKALARRHKEILRIRMAWDERLEIAGITRAVAVGGSSETFSFSAEAKDLTIMPLNFL